MKYATQYWQCTEYSEDEIKRVEELRSGYSRLINDLNDTKKFCEKEKNFDDARYLRGLIKDYESAQKAIKFWYDWYALGKGISSLNWPEDLYYWFDHIDYVARQVHYENLLKKEKENGCGI